MRLVQRVTIPEKEFNAAVREGTAGQKIANILEAIHPENVYFTLNDGHRCALVFLNIDDASRTPAICEPWFLEFNATIELSVAMTPEDLQNSDLGKYQETAKR